MAGSDESSVAERNYHKFSNVANDNFTHRSANKYIEKLPYSFSPPFGARNEALELDVLVPKAVTRAKSPISNRFPPPGYNTYQSITKCDFRWASPENSLAMTRSISPTTGRSNCVDKRTAVVVQKAQSIILAKPNFCKADRISPVGKKIHPTARVNRFIEQNKGTSWKGWMPTY